MDLACPFAHCAIRIRTRAIHIVAEGTQARNLVVLADAFIGSDCHGKGTIIQQDFVEVNPESR
jgi:hypothetical protein